MRKGVRKNWWKNDMKRRGKETEGRRDEKKLRESQANAFLPKKGGEATEIGGNESRKREHMRM